MIKLLSNLENSLDYQVSKYKDRLISKRELARKPHHSFTAPCRDINTFLWYCF